METLWVSFVDLGRTMGMAFDRSVGGQCGFGDLAVLIIFWFDEGVTFELLGPVLLWAHTAFCLLIVVLRWLGCPREAN
jgi:hypothetical protein